MCVNDSDSFCSIDVASQRQFDTFDNVRDRNCAYFIAFLSPTNDIVGCEPRITTAVNSGKCVHFIEAMFPNGHHIDAHFERA
jgi:hypothetical protein